MDYPPGLNHLRDQADTMYCDLQIKRFPATSPTSIISGTFLLHEFQLFPRQTAMVSPCAQLNHVKLRSSSAKLPSLIAATCLIDNQVIGLRENKQENPIFHGKIYGFRLRCSLFSQPIETSP